MKNSLRRRLLVMVVLCTMLATGGTLSAFAAEEDEMIESADIISSSVLPMDCNLLNSEVHEQNYLKMLAKAYDPDSLTEWEDAFADRTRVTDKIKEQIVKSIDIDNIKTEIITVDGEEIAHDLNISEAAPLVINGKDAVKLEQLELETIGEVSHDGVIESGMCSVNVDKEMSKKLTLYKEFADAVSSSNEEELKKILPQILDDYRAQTDKMEQGLK